jgi:hypothetical protein
MIKALSNTWEAITFSGNGFIFLPLKNFTQRRHGTPRMRRLRIVALAA